MKRPRLAVRRLVLLGRFTGGGIRGGLGIDDLRTVDVRHGIDRVVALVLHALLEGFQTLAEISHQARNFTFSAEQDQHDHQNDEPVPNAKCTHPSYPYPLKAAYRLVFVPDHRRNSYAPQRRRI